MKVTYTCAFSPSDSNSFFASKMAAQKMCTLPVVEYWTPVLFNITSLRTRLQEQEKALAALGNQESLAMFLFRARQKVELVTQDLNPGWEDKLFHAVWALDCVDTWIAAYNTSVSVKISKR